MVGYLPKVLTLATTTVRLSTKVAYGVTQMAKDTKKTQKFYGIYNLATGKLVQGAIHTKHEADRECRAANIQGTQKNYYVKLEQG